MHPDIRAEVARDHLAQMQRRHQAAEARRAAPPPLAFSPLAALYHALRHRRREIATREHHASTSATR
jgi:hypothetical protein